MNKAVQNLFAARIETLQGFDFEDFVKELFLKRFSETGFLPTRPRKDRGCDGILLHSRTILACFGPKEYDYNKFVRKVNEDFADYQKYWHSTHPNWQMVVNHKLDPRQQTYIEKKHPGSVILGLDHLLSIISTEINATSMRHLSNLLGMDSSQVFSSYLAELLENLLLETKTDPSQLTEYKKEHLTALLDKIPLNYTVEDLESAYQDFDLVIPLFPTIRGHISNFTDEEKSRLKSRVVDDYNKMGGDFRQRVISLCDFYLQRFSHEDDEEYRFNIKSVLLYIFEQCLIGRKKEAKP